DADIAEPAWVMDGNYSSLMTNRLARATGIVLLLDNRYANFGRYLRRTLFQRARAGHLEGARDSLKWTMIHWILVRAPGRRGSYDLMAERSGLPHGRPHGMRRANPPRA